MQPNEKIVAVFVNDKFFDWTIVDLAETTEIRIYGQHHIVPFSAPVETNRDGMYRALVYMPRVFSSGLQGDRKSVV